MSAYPPVSSLLLSNEDRSADQFLLHLARALASAGPSAGVALERRVGAMRSRVLVRPSTLLDTIDSTVDARPSAGRAVGGLVAEPPTGWRRRFGVLVATRPEERRPDSGSREGRAILGLPNPMALHGSWIDTRTYWVPRSEGGLWSARLYRLAFPERQPPDPWVEAAGTTLAAHWTTVLGVPCTARELSGWRVRRAWAQTSSDPAPREAWVPVGLDRAVAAASLPRPALSVASLHREPGHFAVFGTSGAGKSTFLAEMAVESIRRGESVVAIDLHGDLTVGIVQRLSGVDRRRVIALDVSRPPTPGINILGGTTDRDLERSVAHLVAALKRLSPDGEAIYWGFRLERIFDSFIRLVQEEGGSLVDLANALQSPARREALRARTRRPELARFLDEIAPVLQRQPDFLWPAASRLSKVALVPALRDLLAPEGVGLDWERASSTGRSLLVRLPFAEIGSEAAALASTLLLARVYLSHVAANSTGARAPRPLLLLLDEAHVFSPRLVGEILSEGRKFGVRALVSTQYPERLSSDVEHAARGTVGTHVCFRVPPSSVRATTEWLGIDRRLSPDHLSALPTGSAIVVGRGVDTLVTPTPPLAPDPQAWPSTVDASRRECGLEEDRPMSDVETNDLGEATEALLLSVLVAQESGVPTTEAQIVSSAARSMAPGGDPADLLTPWSKLVRLRQVLPTPTGWALGSSGAEALGIGRRTGATRESAEHRALLLEAFRVFARKGCRLEILRQGRFDTTLPDARLTLLNDGPVRVSPGELASRIDRARTGWAWRFFHGRNVNVEAEVSGALRAERIRHGCRKALRDGAHALFLVADATRARRVRTVLREMGLSPDRAQVWTLRGAMRARGEPGSAR